MVRQRKEPTVEYFGRAEARLPREPRRQIVGGGRRNGKGKTARKTALNRLLIPLIHFVVCAPALPVAAAQESDGKILSMKPWPQMPRYESLDDFGCPYFPQAVYEEARLQKEFNFEEIAYSSDGLSVRGLLISPKIPGDQKWQAIISNRGGNGDLGRITDSGAPCCSVNTSCLDVADLYLLAKAGLLSSPPTTATGTPQRNATSEA